MSKYQITYIHNDGVAAPPIAQLVMGVADFHLVPISEVRQRLEASSEVPGFIFCELPLPQLKEFLFWVKRHGRLHFVPVCALLGSLEKEEEKPLLKSGAFSILAPPLTREGLLGQLKKFQEQGLNFNDLRELDQNFVSESLEAVIEAEEILKRDGLLMKEGAKEIFRSFHTMKGGASSVQLPVFASFIHRCEEFLHFLESDDPQIQGATKSIILEILPALEVQLNQLKALSLMDEPATALLEKLESLKSIKPQSSGPVVSTPSLVEQGASPAAGNSRSQFLKVPREKIDLLQADLKKILTQKIKLNSYCNRLKEEFHGEQFPQDLAKIIEDLHQASFSMMEFFISMRVVPASRIKAFADSALTRVCQQLGKPATLTFDGERELEIDLPIIECLELAVTHILRNAVDHGLETCDQRVALGKEKNGHITIKIERLGKDQISMICKDDGKGIDHNALKAAVLKKGMMSKEDLDRMDPAQIVDLIFLPSLSTKDQVSETSGRGVGLDAVKQKILDMDGTIKVATTAGIGSTFEIHLPRLFKL